MQIIGMKNAGFTITEAIETELCRGYCIGHSGRQYVTWWYVVRGADVDFYHGHYFIIDWDEPARSKVRARADLYARVAEALAQCAKYGY